MSYKSLILSNTGKLTLKKNLALFQVIAGSVFLAVMAQVAVYLPFSPVPITMQTLGVALLTLSLGPRKASFAVMTYLAQATIGLPVLAGGVSNPLWMVGPKAGYLIGFAVAPYIVGKCLEMQKGFSFFRTWLILTLNELSALLLGTTVLGFFVGWENAFFMGLYPFIPGALFKITIATCSFKPINWIKSKI